MAMNAEGMAQAIMSALEDAGFQPRHEKTGGAKRNGSDIWLAVSKGVINHIQANAEVGVSSGSSAGSYKVS